MLWYIGDPADEHEKKEHNDYVSFYIAGFEKSPVDTANYIVPLSKCAPHSAENRTNLLMDGRDCIIQTTPSRQLPYTDKATQKAYRHVCTSDTHMHNIYRHTTESELCCY